MREKVVILVIPLLIFCVSVAYAGEKKSGKVVDTKIILGTEKLVSRNVSLDRPIWCGNERLIYENDDGIYYYDLKSEKSVYITGVWKSVGTCTPDGEWFLYEDKESLRLNFDKSDSVGVVRRYNFKTGKHQKFLYAYDMTIWKDTFRPGEGLTIHLNTLPEKQMKMPEPVWKVVLLKAYNKSWRIDSYKVDVSYRDSDWHKPIIEVEVSSPKKKIFIITPQFTKYAPLFVDRQKRVYMRVSSDDEEEEDIVRCSIDTSRESISCETVLKSWKNSYSFDLFSDGETFIISKERDDNCLRSMTIGEEKGPCITTEGRIPGSYLAISPDERWLSFRMMRHIGDNNYRSDIYISEIKKIKEGK